MDRLIAAAAWNEAQSLEQALLVASHQMENIDWDELDDWVKRERIAGHRAVPEFYEQVARISQA